MNFSKLSLAAVIAFAFTAGTLLADDSFEYKGYFRVGTQWTSNLTAPTLFGQGGAQKWAGRLGNEDQSRPDEDPLFLEQTFVKNWKNEANNWAKAVVLLNYHGKVNSDNADYVSKTTKSAQENTKLRMRQAYVEMGGLGFAPDSTFWIGKRFLNRDDIFVMDWYFLDFSGNGFGVTNVAGLGLDVAYINRLAGKDNDDAPAGQTTGEKGRLTSNNIVIKYENDIVRVDANVAYFAKNKGTWAQDKKGDPASVMNYMASVMYKPERFFFAADGSSKVIAQVATGSQAHCMWFGNRFTNNLEEDFMANKDFKGFAYVLAFTGVATIGDNINIQPAVGYRSYTLDRTYQKSQSWWPTDASGDKYEGKQTATHIFATARGTFNVTPNLGVALEGGYSMAKADVVSAFPDSWNPAGTGVDAGPAQWAGFPVMKDDEFTKEIKISPALILTMDSSYYTRPQLRLYAVWKSVSDGYKPTAGLYKNKSSAIWYGAQAEAWW